MIEQTPAGDDGGVGPDATMDTEPHDYPSRFSRNRTDQRLETLVRTYVPFVWRVLRRLGLSAQDADDATQTVFIVVASRIDSLLDGSERAFLYRTAANTAMKVRRTYGRRPDYAPEPFEEVPDDGPDPEQLLSLRRARQRLDSLLAQMPSDLRAAFVLFEIEGLSQPEIAEALGVPLGTVASRLRRAREHFTERATRSRPRGGPP